MEAAFLSPQPSTGHNSSEVSDAAVDSCDIRILAISGSLRALSSNTVVLAAAALLTPAGVSVSVYTALDTIPHFNPDLDEAGMTPPQGVVAFRRRVLEADGLLICSPEYAHGVPGSLKNALDWLVSVPGLHDVPVGVLNAAPRSVHAQASLMETIRTMAMVPVPGACITLPITAPVRDAAAILDDAVLQTVLAGAVGALVTAVGERRRLA